jgi:hypothetical protein
VTGFWSLTIYGPDNYLIPNPRGTYGVGDRSNLTSADGTLVYASGDLGGLRDGAFQVLVRTADVIPLNNWTNK